MKKLVVKVIIAIAIGLISGEIVGNSFENVKYFGIHKKYRDKVQISKEEYYSFSSPYRNPSIEVSFNTRLFYTVFLCVSSALAILLLLPELREQKNV